MRTEAKRPLQSVFNDSNPEQLVLLLNEYAGSPRGMELAAIIARLNELGKLDALRSRRPKRMGALHRALMPPVEDDDLESRVLEKVNRMLSSAQFSFHLSRTPTGWTRQWKPVRRFVLGQDTYVLQLGLAMIGDLASTNELAKLHLCEYCKQWFVPSRDRKDTRFCNRDCRKGWHRKTPHGLAKQKEYTARSRALAKRRREAELKLIRAMARSLRPGQA